MSKENKSSFEDLRVYQLSEQLADEIWQIVSTWDYFAKDTVGKQLVRAVDSIGANIAEGCGRWNYKDNSRFIKISRGSLYETKHWRRRAYKRNLLEKSHTEKLKTIIDELLPKLTAYLRSIEKATENQLTINN
jgi:four helix bundle protein